MSQYDFINNLLGIEDENIKITNFLGDFTENNVKYSYYEANLTYEPESCPVCGNCNRKYIHKQGSKITKPKLPKSGGKFIRLKLKKQRFLCLECGSTFSAKSTLVKPNHTISVPLRRELIQCITTKVSERDIAKFNAVSSNTVSRIIDNDFTKLDMRYNSLPENLSFDEFKSTKRCKGNMSFLFLDSSTGQLIDIVENRQLLSLLRYFRKYTKQSRCKVKTICIDMYKPYMVLINKMFPNAKIVIDKFHIVQLLNRALSKTRINVMKELPTNSFEYKRLKKYWKLIHKKEYGLDVSNYKHFTHFKYMMTEYEVVRDTIEVSDILQTTYNIYQSLLLDIKTGDVQSFKRHVLEFESLRCSDEMKTALSSLTTFIDQVIEGIKSPYSNGTIEGVNNFIKVIKRVVFGYKSFFHFRNRILIYKKRVLPIVRGKTDEVEAA